MRYWLVMPAAGSGRRFGTTLPKQYAPLAGRTVIEWSLAPFVADSRCAGIRVVLAAGDAHWARLMLDDPASRLRAVEGGAERWESVQRGLAALPPEAMNDWVLVHDAARPCLTAEELELLLESLEHSPDGALLAVPLADTLKRARTLGTADVAESTVDRDGLWRAQTPQAFRGRALAAALERCAEQHRAPTDEAQAVEVLGLAPRLARGFATNIKITSADDLQLAGAILSSQESGT